MRIYRKKITFGEKTFEVAIDRAMTAEILEENPDVLSDAFELQEITMKYPERGQALVMNMIRDGVYSKFVTLKEKYTDEKCEILRKALPKMLEKAGAPVLISAESIIAYAKENEAEEVLADAIYGMVMTAFTTSEQEKSKIKLAID